MELSVQQKKLLLWVDEKQPVVGMFHNMENITPMIEGGFIEKRPVPRTKGQLIITHAGRAALSAPH